MFNREKRDGEVNFLQVGKNILKEDDLQFTVAYKGEVFTLILPNPAIQASVEIDVAQRLGGFPLDSYPVGHIESVRAYCVIAAITVYDKSPAWFKSPWTCYDEELVGALYEGYLEFRKKFKEALRLDKYEGSR